MQCLIVATLVDGGRPAGSHTATTATWHATDAAGRAVGAGVYIYRMTVGAASQTGRMVLLDGQAGVSAGGMASVMPGASDGGGSNGEGWQVYGLVVSGEGLAPYVDSSFRVEAGMAPVELVVSSGHSGGKATDDDCAFCDLFAALNDQQEEEEAETTEEEEETGVETPAISPESADPSTAFNIETVYLTDRLTEEDKGMVEEAARLWEQIIVGDLPDYEFEHRREWNDIVIEKGEVIDDVCIYVSYLDFDPITGGLGGWGSVMEERDTGLPLIGTITIPSRTTFEEADYPHVDTEMRRVITHEICHALGFGAITPWDSFLKKKDGRSYFDGPQAIEAFNAAGGTS